MLIIGERAVMGLMGISRNHGAGFMTGSPSTAGPAKGASGWFRDEVMGPLERVLSRVVRECTALGEGERCLLIMDHRSTGLRRALEAAVRSHGGVLSTAEVPEQVYLGDHFPEWLEGRMVSAEVIYILTAKPFPHAPRRRAARAGARVLSLCMVDEEMALRALDVDYTELSRVTRTLAGALDEAGEVLITTPSGTELRLEIGGRVVAIDGLAREPGGISALPAGVVAALPVPGTAEGRVVLDGSLTSMGLLGEPIILVVEKGRVVEVRGGAEAAELRRAFGEDANAACIAEFGMGTNPKAVYTGKLVEDERVRGSAHIGLGGNTHLGGTIRSSLHLDGTLRRPTVHLDGRMVVEEGSLVL